MAGEVPYSPAEAAFRTWQRHEAHRDQTYRAFRREVAETLGIAESATEPVILAAICALERGLPVEQAYHLEAQLPLRIVGQLRDCDRHSQRRSARPSRDSVLKTIAEHLGDDAAHAERVARAVFHVLARRVSAGEIRAVVRQLPREVRSLWPEHLQKPRARKRAASGKVKVRENHVLAALRKLPREQQLVVLRSAIAHLAHDLDVSEREQLWWDLSVATVSGRMAKRRRGNRDELVSGRA